MARSDIDALGEALRGEGLRLTAQRLAVYEHFAGSARALSLVQAARELCGRSIGLATVYRTVRTLAALGFLAAEVGEDGEVRYTASRPGHAHRLRCTGCERSVEFSDCGLEGLARALSERTGFAIQGHHLELFGRCPDCGGADGKDRGRIG